MGKKLDSQLEVIAKKHLRLDTLETRRSDSLDFHEHAVWCVKEALEEAYNLGYNEGKRRMVTSQNKAQGGVVIQRRCAVSDIHPTQQQYDYINGIGYIVFPSTVEARQHLLDIGCSQEDLGSFMFVDVDRVARDFWN